MSAAEAVENPALPSLIECGSSAAISFERVGKVFHRRGSALPALLDVSFDVQPNEFVSLVGPSGCGKSTLLRMAAGMIAPNSGRVIVNGRQVRALNTGSGFVTQDSKLFPWLTLRQNVEFALVARKVPPRERAQLVAEHIAMMGLDGFEGHYPFELSGGMQKRASIARTLIYEPDIILMDEPFGSVDALTKMRLQAALLRIWESKRKTILFVTHDLSEAIALSDTVIIMSRHPGTVKGRFHITLPRPRNVYEIQLEPGFAETYGRVWESFREEVLDDA